MDELGHIAQTGQAPEKPDRKAVSATAPTLIKTGAPQ